MTTAYTSLLGLALPVTGELSGTWGDTVNNSITSLVDTAVAGTTNVSADSNVTLTTTTGASNQARQAILLFSGARTAIRTVTAPAQSKIYTVINATTGGFAVQLVGAGPTTGVTIVAGESAVCAWNGSDFVKVSNTGGSGTFTNLTVTGVATFSAGSAAAPAITTTGDTNTGIFFPAADTIAFAEGGAEAMRIDASGRLLVGTTSSIGTATVGRLQVLGGETFVTTNSEAGGFVGVNSNADNSLALVADLDNLRSGSHIAFYVDGFSEKMRLDASGNLGLGVTPSAWSSTYFRTLQVNSLGSYVSGTNATYSGTPYFFIGNNGYDDTGSGFKYTTTNAASQYVQVGGAHQWKIAPSGTAGNAITFTQAMTLDASGRLGIGQTSPSTALSFADSAGTAGDPNKICLFAATGTPTYGFGISASQLDYVSGGSHVFFSRSGSTSTERCRIDSSGNFLVGITASSGTPANGVTMVNTTGASAVCIGHSNGTGGGNSYMNFAYNAGAIGSITQSGTTAVLYNTTSDQRLKENIQDADSASSLIDALQVRKFDWKSDNSHQRYGFVAQELVTVAPEAVYQPEDTEAMMAVDYSKLVPMLVKEIQSLRQRVAQLESN